MREHVDRGVWINIVLNTDEAHVVLTLTSALLLDDVDLTKESREQIREWRSEHGPGFPELDKFTIFLNERLGNRIDEQTTRMMRVRGDIRTSQADRWR